MDQLQKNQRYPLLSRGSQWRRKLVLPPYLWRQILLSMSLLTWMLLLSMSIDHPLQSAPIVDNGAISGMVWWDRNASGFWELDETAVTDWPVYLQAEADLPNGPIQERITDGTGAFTYSDLAPGIYFLWSIDSRGDTPKARIEIGEVGLPISRDIASIGWTGWLPDLAKAALP